MSKKQLNENAIEKAPKAPKAEIRLTVYGHRCGTYSEALDNLVMAGGTLQAMTEALCRLYPAKSTERNRGALVAHIAYLPVIKGVEVKVSEETLTSADGKTTLKVKHYQGSPIALTPGNGKPHKARGTVQAFQPTITPALA